MNSLAILHVVTLESLADSLCGQSVREDVNDVRIRPVELNGVNLIEKLVESGARKLWFDFETKLWRQCYRRGEAGKLSEKSTSGCHWKKAPVSEGLTGAHKTPNLTTRHVSSEIHCVSMFISSWLWLPSIAHCARTRVSRE